MKAGHVRIPDRVVIAVEDRRAAIVDIIRNAKGNTLDPSQTDPAAERFRELHARLHEAVFAVLEVSEGEIRFLI